MPRISYLALDRLVLPLDLSTELCKLHLHRHPFYVVWLCACTAPIQKLLVVTCFLRQCVRFILQRVCTFEESDQLLLGVGSRVIVCLDGNLEIKELEVMLKHLEQSKTNTKADMKASFAHLEQPEKGKAGCAQLN